MKEIEEIKNSVRNRDVVCTKCGMTNEENIKRTKKRLHVHRIRPGSKYGLEECVTLCAYCHYEEHKVRVKVQDALSKILHVRLSASQFEEIERAATDRDEGMSEWVRNTLLYCAKEEAGLKTDDSSARGTG